MGREQARLLRSTIRWAEKEYMKWMQKYGLMKKQDATELFIQKMDDYSTRNPHTSMIFSIAKDVGVAMLDDLIMKGEAK